MASPHVAGVAALVGREPNLSPADVEDLLKAPGECPNGQRADANGAAIASERASGQMIRTGTPSRSSTLCAAPGGGRGSAADHRDHQPD